MNAKHKTVLMFAAFAVILAVVALLFGPRNAMLTLGASAFGVVMFIAGARRWGWTWMFDPLPSEVMKKSRGGGA